MEEIYKNILCDRDTTIMNEMYFNESDEMKELLQLLGDVRGIVFGKKSTKGDRVSSSKQMSLFNKKVASFFGFKTFALQVVDAKFINAWTIPISSKLDVGVTTGKKYISVTSKGYKFTGGGFVTVVCITSKLFASKSYTDRDIMGVILHEIGHNFSYALNGGQCLFALANKSANINCLLAQLICTWIVDKEDAEDMSKDIFNNEDNLVSNLASYISKQEGLVMNMTKFIMKPLSYIFLTCCTLYDMTYGFIIRLLTMYHPINLLCRLYGFRDENIGDNFATMYGFGPEVAKFESNIYKMKHKKEPSFFSDVFSVAFFPVFIAIDLAEVHPRQISRCLDQIRLLERELLKEDMDEDMRRQILLDIKNTQLEYNKLLKVMDKYDTAGAKAYNKLMTKLFGGDFRNIFINKNRFFGSYDKIEEE